MDKYVQEINDSAEELRTKIDNNKDLSEKKKKKLKAEVDR